MSLACTTMKANPEREASTPESFHKQCPIYGSLLPHLVALVYNSSPLSPGCPLTLTKQSVCMGTYV